MSIPLIMTGPGGDFTTSYDVKGQSLVKQVGATLKQQPDTESGSSFAGYYKSPRRQNKKPGQRLSGGPSGGLPLGTADRLADEFVHQEIDEVYQTTGIYQATGIPVTGHKRVRSFAPVQTQIAAGGQASSLTTKQAERMMTTGAAVAAGTAEAAGKSGKAVQSADAVAAIESIDAQTELEQPCLTPAMVQAVQTWLDLQRRALRVLSQEAVTLNQTVQACQQSRVTCQTHETYETLETHESEESFAPMTTSHAATTAGHAATHQAALHTANLATFTPEVTHGDESDAQTIENSHTDSRSAADARLFADHEGARRGTGRQQSHGVRAHRSANQKRGLAATAKQGSLFGAESRY